MPASDPVEVAEPKWRTRARFAEYCLIGALVAAGWLQLLWSAFQALARWLG